MVARKIHRVGTLFLLLTATRSARHLFDLEADPLESTDLESQSHIEAQNSSPLNQRLIEFSSLWRNPEFPSSLPNISTFVQAGGIVPFLPSSEPRSSDSEPSLPVAGDSQTQIPPNIIFVMLDDVGWNDVSFGNQDSSYMSFSTPNMNTLSQKGITLSRHYTPWLCLPSRAAFLTGRYPIRLGLQSDPAVKANLPLDETTIAQELQKYGYRTALVGENPTSPIAVKPTYPNFIASHKHELEQANGTWGKI